MNLPSARIDVPRDGKRDGERLAPPLPGRGLIRLTPLNRRRLNNFRANTRGYWSFWIFLFCFVASLFAEFIANDKPILVFYKGEYLFPVFHDYPEEKFGGFLARTDYRAAVIGDGDQCEWLHDLATDPLFLPNDQPRFADAGAIAADLDVARRPMREGGSPCPRPG